MSQTECELGKDSWEMRMSEMAITERTNRSELAELLTDVPPWQVFACTLIAEYKQPIDVIKQTVAEFGDAVSERWIRRCSGVIARPRRYDDIIQAMRANYGEMTNEPIMDPAWRMQQRRRIVIKAIAAGEYDQAREALADVERLGGSMPYAAPAGVNLQVNIDNAPVSPARQRILSMMAESGDGPLLLAPDAQQTPEDAPGSTIDIIDIVPGH